MQRLDVDNSFASGLLNRAYCSDTPSARKRSIGVNPLPRTSLPAGFSKIGPWYGQADKFIELLLWLPASFIADEGPPSVVFALDRVEKGSKMGVMSSWKPQRAYEVLKINGVVLHEKVTVAFVLHMAWEVFHI
jgi:hypothetical protein